MLTALITVALVAIIAIVLWPCAMMLAARRVDQALAEREATADLLGRRPRHRPPRHHPLEPPIRDPGARLLHALRIPPGVWLALKIVVLPIILCQALALVSFIHEEALQAAGFAAYGAIKSGDSAVALDAVERFEDVMFRAQNFQSGWGKAAWWASPAYESYFFQAAPAQLASFYAQGVTAELWESDASRWVTRPGKDDVGVVFVDTWTLDPIDKLRARGFRPELIPVLQMKGGPYPDEEPRTIDSNGSPAPNRPETRAERHAKLERQALKRVRQAEQSERQQRR